MRMCCRLSVDCILMQTQKGGSTQDAAALILPIASMRTRRRLWADVGAALELTKISRVGENRTMSLGAQPGAL